MQVAAKNLDFSSRNEAKIDRLRADFELKNHVLSVFSGGKIVSYLQEHPSASLRELEEALGMSRPTIIKYRRIVQSSTGN